MAHVLKRGKRKKMKTADTVEAFRTAEKSQGVADILKILDKECTDCKPVTPQIGRAHV